MAVHSEQKATSILSQPLGWLRLHGVPQTPRMLESPGVGLVFVPPIVAGLVGLPVGPEVVHLMRHEPRTQIRKPGTRGAPALRVDGGEGKAGVGAKGQPQAVRRGMAAPLGAGAGGGTVRSKRPF